jgi:acetolactate synthase-1/2/3 large subunit
VTGADVLIEALADAGVEVCFANPGTSEMQLVAAIDGEPRMRAILGLFEGVVTGAAYTLVQGSVTAQQTCTMPVAPTLQ